MKLICLKDNIEILGRENEMESGNLILAKTMVPDDKEKNFIQVLVISLFENIPEKSLDELDCYDVEEYQMILINKDNILSFQNV